jgi:hypothetical protein
MVYFLFLACLGQVITNIKFMLGSLKTLSNSKKLFRKPHHISVSAFLRSEWLIFSSKHPWQAFGTISGSQAAFGTFVTVTGGYWTPFIVHLVTLPLY